MVSKEVFAQVPKPIYFLLDTINIPKENRIVEAGIEGAWRYYSFYCRCIREYDRNITFVYLSKNQGKTRTDKPALLYTSWKDLSQLIWLEGKKFDEKYSLNVIETLPNNEYLINQVKMFIAETKY